MWVQGAGFTQNNNNNHMGGSSSVLLDELVGAVEQDRSLLKVERLV